MRKLWHSLISGHQWQMRGQSVCPPDQGLAKWASGQGKEGLTVKSRYGWSECLLVCNCGTVLKLEMIGTGKPMS